MDRIDIHIEVTPVVFSELTQESQSEKSETVRERVIKAREIQGNRFKGNVSIHCNAQMSSKVLKEVCKIDAQGKEMLKKATDRLGLSARAFDRILKVARTIADLDASTNILPTHLAEAIQYRSLDRDNWAM